MVQSRLQDENTKVMKGRQIDIPSVSLDIPSVSLLKHNGSTHVGYTLPAPKKSGGSGWLYM